MWSRNQSSSTKEVKTFEKELQLQHIWLKFQDLSCQTFVSSSLGTSSFSPSAQSTVILVSAYIYWKPHNETRI